MSLAATLVGWIIGVVGIILALKAKRRKKIRLCVTEHRSTVTFTEDIKSQTRILYRNVEVDQIDRYEIIVVNTGNVSIDGSEIESPIVFSSPEGSQILKHDVIVQSKEHIEGRTITSDENKFQLSFTLLKPKDTIRILLLCSNLSDNPIQCSGRIVGLPRFHENKLQSTKPPYESFKKELRDFGFFALLSIFCALGLKFIVDTEFEKHAGFPRKEYSSFRLFKIVNADSNKVEYKISFPFLFEDSEGLHAPPALRPPGVQGDVINLRSGKGTNTLIDSLMNRLNDKILSRGLSYIDRQFSQLDSSGIVENVGVPDSIVYVVQDTIGNLALKIETWFYEPVDIFSIVKNRFSRSTMVQLALGFVIFLLAFVVMTLSLVQAVGYFRILDSHERKRLRNSIVLLPKKWR